MSTEPKIHWTKVPICGREAEQIDPASAEGRKALAEYRTNGDISGYWLCTPEQFEQDDVDALGPNPDEIDWTGFDSTGQAERTPGPVSHHALVQAVFDGFMASGDDMTCGELAAKLGTSASNIARVGIVEFDNSHGWLRIVPVKLFRPVENVKGAGNLCGHSERERSGFAITKEYLRAAIAQATRKEGA